MPDNSPDDEARNRNKFDIDKISEDEAEYDDDESLVSGQRRRTSKKISALVDGPS